MSSRAEVMERLVSPLYLEVPGTEIDRLRTQLTSLFQVRYQDIPPDVFLVCSGNEHHHIVFGLSWPDVESAISDPAFQHISRELDSSMLVGAAEVAHRDYYRLDPESDKAARTLDMLGCLLFQAANVQKSCAPKPDARLMIINLSYRKFSGEHGLLFCTTWKRPLSHE